MNYLSVEGISKRFGERTLFENLNFGIEKGKKVALIAPNGTGKTSLMRILALHEPPDSGLVVYRNGIRVALLEQEPEFNLESSVLETVFEGESPILNAIRDYELSLESQDPEAMQEAFERIDQLQAWDYETKARQILERLKISNFHQKVASLSGGQKRRLALAKLLLADAELLLLDEPTNHLDIDMIEWLEKYLSSSNITLLMITHDRYFLDRVCNEILELDQNTLFTYKGNYAYFLEKRNERYQSMASSISKAQNLYTKELDWMRRQPKARTTKSQARIDSFHQLSEKAHTRIAERQLLLAASMARLGNKVIEAHNLGMSYDNQNWLFRKFNYKFIPGERVGIIGVNGAGKSTFIKCLTKEIVAAEGRVEHGETVVFGYYGQEGLQFKHGQRVIELVQEIAENFELPGGKSIGAAQMLERFLFPRHAHYTQVEKLSGGEKRRLYLLTVLLKSPNVLILDEPTNDLDILTLNVLEEYLQSFAGCLIVISHDRFFLDKLVDHLFILEGNTNIKDFPGNYSLYRDYLLVQDNKEPETKAEVKKGDVQIKSNNSEPKEKTKLSYNEKREFEQLENEIAELESEKELLQEKLNSGNLNHEDLLNAGKRIALVIDLIDKKELRWLELSERA